MPRNAITITFKECEESLYVMFKNKYCSPSARLKDLIKQDLQEQNKKAEPRKAPPLLKK